MNPQIKRILREGGWVATGQLLTAVASLVSIRVMTELLTPEEFGRMTLMVGVVALAIGLVSTPRLQALIRYYPEFANLGRLGILRHVASRLISSLVAIAAIFIVCGWGVASLFSEVTWLSGLLIATLLVIDAIRGFELAILNAARRQSVAAKIQTADAWARPLLAVALVMWLGGNAEAALLGYIIGSGLVVMAMRFIVRMEVHAQHSQPKAQTETPAAVELAEKIRRYAWPLAPLAIFGWFSGMGDRYLIGGMLGLAEAGVYAAIYALTSRPFLMLSALIEQTLRPVLQNAIASKDYLQVEKIKKTMLLTMSVGSIFGVICFTLVKDIAAALLLAEQYRAAANLMPWIALGYALLSISHVYTRLCYAYDATDYVLILTMCSSVIGVAVTVPAIILHGFTGAVVAVPIRFGVEIICSRIFSGRAEHRYMQKQKEHVNAAI